MKESEEEKETENEKRVHSSSEEETKDYLSSEEEESTGEIEDKHSSEEHFPSKELGEENYNPPTAVLSPKKIQENQTFSDLPFSNKNITKERNAYPSESKCIECNCTEILERLKNFEDNTVKCLKKVMKSNKELVKMVKQLKDNKVEVARTFYQAEGFPLQTIEQFHEFENDNSKNNQYDKLYHHLRGMGAAKLRDFVHMCFKESMKDELVCKFTWPDDSGTEKFGDTKLVKIMYDAAQSCPLFEGPLNKTVFKAEVQEVLRAVKQRVKVEKIKIKIKLAMEKKQRRRQ
ncbi:uncharacterized protein LOC120357094 [Solenopsis invicta]|uniref:uncharacterized protein LOC120357094 n=1 Tax=Solenopsis invicta TaxID=13686 RepID=UPI00193CFD0C|nr:uncharacterized protein LOC120357094 [Solenopsis invicta]